MKLKFNWGYGLMLVFLAFGTMMSYLVYRSVKTNFDLVSKEYYKEEIVYQQVIDGTAQAAALSATVSLTQNDRSLLLQLPPEMKDKAVKGTVLFYYAPDAKKDREFDLAMTPLATQTISSDLFTPGDYSMRVTWDCNDQHFYSAQTVRIN